MAAALPSQCFVLLRVPGAGRDTARAVASVGGLQQIEASLADPQVVPRASLPGGGEPGASVEGRVREVAGLLLRVTRRTAHGRGAGSSDNVCGGESCALVSESARCRVELLGRVERAVEFDALADFRPWRAATAAASGAGEDDLLSALAPPAALSLFPRPRVYAFRDNLFALSKDGPPPPERASTLVPLDAPRVPEGPQLLAGASGAALDRKPAVRALKRAFHTRPVWLLKALAHALRRSGIAASQLREFLPVVAFRFARGPFRHCWVRYGFDPRTDPDARRFQAIEFRVPRAQASRWRARLAAAGAMRQGAAAEEGGEGDDEGKQERQQKSNEDAEEEQEPNEEEEEEEEEEDMDNGVDGGAEDSAFRIMPQKLVTRFQICDLAIQSVQQLIETAPVAPRFNATTGWFMRETLAKVRAAMHVRGQLWLQRGRDAPLPDAVAEAAAEENDEEDGEEEDGEVEDDEEPVVDEDADADDEAARRRRHEAEAAAAEEDEEDEVEEEEEQVREEDVVEAVAPGGGMKKKRQGARDEAETIHSLQHAVRDVGVAAFDILGEDDAAAAGADASSSSSSPPPPKRRRGLGGAPRQ
jgi:general transcription factor 3C polypeptide 5 (transcription factor C subunit 1)